VPELYRQLSALLSSGRDEKSKLSEIQGLDTITQEFDPTAMCNSPWHARAPRESAQWHEVVETYRQVCKVHRILISQD
jgi:hypothetical protein